MSSARIKGKPAFVDPDSRPWEQCDVKELRDNESEPKQRIKLVSDTDTGYQRSFGNVVVALNRSLANNLPRGAGRTGEIIVKRVLGNGLNTTLGLDYWSDFVGDILPRVATLGREVVDSDLEQDTRLNILANMAGVAIAESQSFSGGNNQTARATTGWIRKGLEGIVEAHNAVMDFEPPQELEKLILLQNLTRLRDQKTGDTFPDLLGGRYIDPSIEESLTLSRERLDLFRNHYGKSNIKGLSDAEWNKVELSNNLALRMGGRRGLPEAEQKTLHKALAILFQEEYGPASYSLVSDNSDLFETFDLDFAEQLIKANTQLLRMRIVSLVSGLANGGQFMGIEDVAVGDEDYGFKARKITRIDWNPTTSLPADD